MPLRLTAELEKELRQGILAKRDEILERHKEGNPFGRRDVDIQEFNKCFLSISQQGIPDFLSDLHRFCVSKLKGGWTKTALGQLEAQLKRVIFSQYTELRGGDGENGSSTSSSSSHGPPLAGGVGRSPWSFSEETVQPLVRVLMHGAGLLEYLQAEANADKEREGEGEGKENQPQKQNGVDIDEGGKKQSNEIAPPLLASSSSSSSSNEKGKEGDSGRGKDDPQNFQLALWDGNAVSDGHGQQQGEKGGEGGEDKGKGSPSDRQRRERKEEKQRLIGKATLFRGLLFECLRTHLTSMEVVIQKLRGVSRRLQEAERAKTAPSEELCQESLETIWEAVFQLFLRVDLSALFWSLSGHCETPCMLRSCEVGENPQAKEGFAQWKKMVGRAFHTSQEKERGNVEQQEMSQRSSKRKNAKAKAALSRRGRAAENDSTLHQKAYANLFEEMRKLLECDHLDTVAAGARRATKGATSWIPLEDSFGHFLLKNQVFRLFAGRMPFTFLDRLAAEVGVYPSSLPRTTRDALEYHEYLLAEKWGERGTWGRVWKEEERAVRTQAAAECDELRKKCKEMARQNGRQGIPADAAILSLFPEAPPRSDVTAQQQQEQGAKRGQKKAYPGEGREEEEEEGRDRDVPENHFLQLTQNGEEEDDEVEEIRAEGMNSNAFVFLKARKESQLIAQTKVADARDQLLHYRPKPQDEDRLWGRKGPAPLRPELKQAEGEQNNEERERLRQWVEGNNQRMDPVSRLPQAIMGGGDENSPDSFGYQQFKQPEGEAVVPPASRNLLSPPASRAVGGPGAALASPVPFKTPAWARGGDDGEEKGAMELKQEEAGPHERRRAAGRPSLIGEAEGGCLICPDPDGLDFHTDDEPTKVGAFAHALHNSARANRRPSSPPPSDSQKESGVEGGEEREKERRRRREGREVRSSESESRKEMGGGKEQNKRAPSKSRPLQREQKALKDDWWSERVKRNERQKAKRDEEIQRRKRSDTLSGEGKSSPSSPSLPPAESRRGDHRRGGGDGGNRKEEEEERGGTETVEAVGRSRGGSKRNRKVSKSADIPSRPDRAVVEEEKARDQTELERKNPPGVCADNPEAAAAAAEGGNPHGDPPSPPPGEDRPTQPSKEKLRARSKSKKKRAANAEGQGASGSSVPLREGVSSLPAAPLSLMTKRPFSERNGGQGDRDPPGENTIPAKRKKTENEKDKKEEAPVKQKRLAREAAELKSSNPFAEEDEKSLEKRRERKRVAPAVTASEGQKKKQGLRGEEEEENQDVASASSAAAANSKGNAEGQAEGGKKPKKRRRSSYIPQEVRAVVEPLAYWKRGEQRQRQRREAAAAAAADVSAKQTDKEIRQEGEGGDEGGVPSGTHTRSGQDVRTENSAAAPAASAAAAASNPHVKQSRKEKALLELKNPNLYWEEGQRKLDEKRAEREAAAAEKKKHGTQREGGREEKKRGGGDSAAASSTSNPSPGAADSNKQQRGKGRGKTAGVEEEKAAFQSASSEGKPGGGGGQRRRRREETEEGSRCSSFSSSASGADEAAGVKRRRVEGREGKGQKGKGRHLKSSEEEQRVVQPSIHEQRRGGGGTEAEAQGGGQSRRSSARLSFASST
uniref:Uncharacterized protein n=1 Tax=Chromera velia CCMP2878 TaxID=1169474 RepID=A0A0G4IAD9_9ALVE|eukprot:Cvel_12491.t1-p1 / transcript=Cvel_12491.t1 / gene=Cvel_12491 / organism=Chromera_velia_CCMP2878 / gene_product=hypothetical protein / transcript_product=hypothetical protein / location=Cvel_scaffold819:33503-42730(+) / protein_length=1603 / sequence_SO=supercontig / SO=protein_coding / is_pseudo=false